MKKKIALLINEPLKVELEKSVIAILEKILTVQQLAKQQLNINLDDTDQAISFIEKYTKQSDIDSIELQNQLLFIKFEKEVSKIMEDYPSLIKTKALEMFCHPSDREIAKQVILYCVSINRSLEKYGVNNLELKHFVLSGQFVYNPKLDTRLKDVYTTYCENKKQVELKELAEKLRDIVLHSIKFGLISDNAIGINVDNIIDINTGKIKYNKIARYS